MNLQRNAIANYLGQGVNTLLALFVTPMFLLYLGAEAFGLIGFFMLMQVWLRLLDLGLAPTLARHIAAMRGQGEIFADFHRLLRSMECVLLVLAGSVVIAIWLASPWVAAKWLQSETLDAATVQYAVGLMGSIIGVRLFSSLYRSGLTGYEDLVWLNGALIVTTTVRLCGALALVAYWTPDIHLFFEFQAAVFVLEALVVAARFYSRANLGRDQALWFGFDWQALRPIAPYAMSVAYAAGIWILIGQIDKLILSTLLPLEKFGYFSLVSLVAGALPLLVGPINQALLPRMTALVGAGKIDEMLTLYQSASQLVLAVSLSAALLMGLYAEPLIFAWSGSAEAASWAGDILIWFVLGNAFLTLSAYQHMLQQAFGNLRLHVIGVTLSLFVQVPLIYYGAVTYGALGAGMAWFGIRLLWFLWWVPIIHRKFVPGFHLKWMVGAMMPTALVVTVSAFGLYYLFGMDFGENRVEIFTWLAIIGGLQLAIVLPFVSPARKYVLQKVRGAA